MHILKGKKIFLKVLTKTDFCRAMHITININLVQLDRALRDCSRLSSRRGGMIRAFFTICLPRMILISAIPTFDTFSIIQISTKGAWNYNTIRKQCHNTIIKYHHILKRFSGSDFRTVILHTTIVSDWHHSIRTLHGAESLRRRRIEFIRYIHNVYIKRLIYG